MPTQEQIARREARHGPRMIEVKVRFWTDDIEEGARAIRPKHAWTAGIVRLQANKAHGLTSGTPVHFHSLLDLGSALEQVLVQQGIELHPSRRMRHYLSGEAPPSRQSRRPRKQRRRRKKEG